MKSHTWTFEKRTPLRPGGINLAEPNFTRESKKIVRLFVREFDQNVIDARGDDPNKSGNKIKAHVRFKILDIESGLDIELLKEIFKPLEEHLCAAGHTEKNRDWHKPKVLVIEEFQTVGLTGTVDDSFAEGETQRWANFWFGEGKRSKTGRALGRQGQGKITYHLVSGARAVLALTRREYDPVEYVFGKCIVQKTHKINDLHFTQHGYWPKGDPVREGQPLPETDPALVKRIREGFKLARGNETGTSWIIPFIPESFTCEELLREFVGDFFFSVLNGDLTAEIGATKVDSGTLQKIFQDLKIEEPTQC